jgi:hypothetical protein
VQRSRAAKHAAQARWAAVREVARLKSSAKSKTAQEPHVPKPKIRPGIAASAASAHAMLANAAA